MLNLQVLLTAQSFEIYDTEVWNSFIDVEPKSAVSEYASANTIHEGITYVICLHCLLSHLRKFLLDFDSSGVRRMVVFRLDRSRAVDFDDVQPTVAPIHTALIGLITVLKRMDV